MQRLFLETPPAHKRKFTGVVVCVLLALFCWNSNALGAPQADDTLIEEEVLAMVEMEVVLEDEYLYYAGDPPTQAHNSFYGRHSHTGLWTFVRLKGGTGYVVFHGRREGPQLPYAVDAAATGSHTCVDGEGFVIGNRSFHFSVKDVRPAMLEISNAGGGKFWLFVSAPRFTTDTPIGWSGATGECDTFDPEQGGCMNAPPWRAPEIHSGVLPEAAVIDWSDLVGASQGTGPALSFGFTYEDREDWEDSFGYANSNIVTYQVQGFIRAEDWLILEPLVD